MSRLLFHIRFDCFFSILLRVFMARNAADRDTRKRGLKVLLREDEVRYQQVVRNILAAIKDLLRHPEGQR